MLTIKRVRKPPVHELDAEEVKILDFSMTYNRSLVKKGLLYKSPV